MIEHVDVTHFGRPATQALAARVRAAKATAGPLAPVTVIVSSNFAGLTARRLLGGAAVGEPGRTAVGIANVSFITPLRLLDQLAPPSGRTRLTNPVLRAAVRQALRTHPGSFQPVRDHPATESAIAELFGELSHVSSRSLDAISSSSTLAHDAVVLHRRVIGLIAGIDTEDDLAAAATDRSDLAAAVAALGHVVWYLPERLTPSLGRLLAAVFTHARSAAIVGVTDNAAADRATFESCRRVGVPLDGSLQSRATGSVATDNAAPIAARIISVTDPDEEVREVARSIVELADTGVPLERIGIFYPVRSPYLRTLHQRLAAAGIPANGPSPERLADSVAGRTLLAALALPDERWRRDRVMALVADAPVRDGDRAARPSSWERLSRDAGIVGDDWTAKLEWHATLTQRRLDEPRRPLSDGQRRNLERTLSSVAELRNFMAALTDAVAAVSTASTWADKSAAATRLLHQLIGNDRRWQLWDEPEQSAAQQVERALVRLGALDPLDPDPSHRVFQRALIGELDVPRGRRRPFGHGVTFGPLVAAAGYDLDAVFVLGMAEGQCPAPRGDDALLPDSARALAAEGELPRRSDRLDDQHRAYLAALASAPAEQRTLTFPRGDLRASRHRLASRWLLDTVSDLRGKPVYATDFGALDLDECPWLTVVTAHADGLSVERPESVQDWETAAIASSPRQLVDHPGIEPVRRGLTCLSERSSDRFTEWDGNLAGEQVPSPARTDELLSATRLETWADCGMRYLLASVLGLGDREEPEKVVELSALDRGTALHDILERFVGEAIAAGTVPDPDEPWSDDHRARLHAIAEEVLDGLERRGLTGRDLLWRQRRADTILGVGAFLDADDQFRRLHRSTPTRVEFPFGSHGAEPVRVELSDGRAVRFRGSADRVDVTEDGRRVVVDYKSGKGDKYDKIATEDAVRGGTTLQLGLYSEAVHQLDGAADASAYYWMIDGGAASPTYGYPWTDDRRDRFLAVVEAMVDGIEAGVFPVVPGEWDSWRGTHKNCTYCPFDTVCPGDRGDHAASKSGAPELAVRAALQPPEAAARAPSLPDIEAST